MKINALSEYLQIEHPLIQAPMAGGATTPELIAAVSNAGGLGSLGAGYMSGTQIKEAIIQIRALTDKPFAVNLFIPNPHHADQTMQQAMCDQLNHVGKSLNIDITPQPGPYQPDFDEQFAAVLQTRPPIFSFTFGMLETSYIKKLKKLGIIVIGTATSLIEAQALENAGIDIIVTQGIEAGGHRGTFIGPEEATQYPLRDLIPEIVAHTNLPVIAAGGIGDRETIKAALSLGAHGVQIGTAFLTTPEAGIHKAYKEHLLTSTEDETCLTRAFSGKLARGIRNTYIKEMQGPYLPYPIQNALTKPLRQAAAKQNNSEYMSLWCGQNGHLCQATPAAELVKQWMSELL